MAELKTSPLHDRHQALGARFAEFGGWSMPLQYAGIVSEHKAVREAVGIFDVSHLGKARVTGPGAAEFLNACITNDVHKIGVGQAQYTLLCNDAGGVVDDLIWYWLAEDEIFLIPNAANTAEVVALLSAAAPAGITVVNEHDDHAVLAVQGPASDETLAALGLPVGHDYMRFDRGSIGDVELTVCRTGYTGERGYELVVPWASAGAVWDAVLAAGEQYGIAPAGLGARDTLRTEMGYPLHGQDLRPDVSAGQCGVGWAIGWKKESFWGEAALRAEKAAGPERRLTGLVAQGRGIPRPHMEVVHDGEVVGEVTSGTFSPTLGKGIALALLPPALVPGTVVSVRVRNREEPFEVAKPPFVTPGVRGA
ncbi:MAG: glycine cleavage system aminomethyltransferase GcvT [Micropruina sp.]|uniref:glycine cleavage system aminomethyltransferase GcvT n=1 Tax=Micropruina sp. TaxID=2737536 RepID=UPI0039E2A484